MPIRARTHKVTLASLNAREGGEALPSTSASTSSSVPEASQQPSPESVVPQTQSVIKVESVPSTDGGGLPPADGDGGGSGGSGGGGGGDRGDEDNGGPGDEILSLRQVEEVAAKENVTLPSDLLEIAKSSGLRASALSAYLALQGKGLAGLLARHVPWVRNRLMADHRFLFVVLAECAIDTGCCTVAEVRKRGDDFWHEFEFYLSDLLVGLVLDVVLVTLMAPVAPLAGTVAAASKSGLQRWLETVPSAVFAPSVPGVRKYSALNRLSCLLVKFCEYSLAGIACGAIGQGMANGLMAAKRHFHGSKEDDVEIPPLAKTALVWGLFMGVSANVRYQTVFGLERLVDMTIAKHVPQVAYGTTIAIRFCNNVIGGENFIDMARWAGVQ